MDGGAPNAARQQVGNPINPGIGERKKRKPKGQRLRKQKLPRGVLQVHSGDGDHYDRTSRVEKPVTTTDTIHELGPALYGSLPTVFPIDRGTKRQSGSSTEILEWC